MDIAVWLDDQGAVYVLRGDKGTYQKITDDGQVSEQLSLPGNADLIGEMAVS